MDEGIATAVLALSWHQLVAIPPTNDHSSSLSGTGCPTLKYGDIVPIPHLASDPDHKTARELLITKAGVITARINSAVFFLGQCHSTKVGRHGGLRARGMQ